MPNTQNNNVSMWSRYSRFLPWLILVVSLLLTYKLWQYDERESEQRQKIRFEAQVHEIMGRIRDRMKAYEHVMHGAKGLFYAGGSVEHPAFHEYVAALTLEKDYPGIQGLGFNVLVPPAGKEKHIAAMRKKSFPAYTIRPEGERDLYTAIIFLEPDTAMNGRAIGFDTYSDPVRRLAMERARDSEDAAITGKIKLVQETNNNVQAGVLMFVPVYKNGAPHATVAERRSNLLGWISAPFRMNDLMGGILGDRALPVAVQIEIFDGILDNVEMTEQNLLFRKMDSEKAKEEKVSRFQELTILYIAGRSWSVVVRSLPDFEENQGIVRKYLIPASGIAISILLAFLGYSLLNTRDRAVTLARSMTQELTVSNENAVALGNENAQLHQRLSLATDSAGIGVWDYWVPENRLIWDKWMYALYGVQEENFSGAYDAWRSGLHPDDRERGDMEINQALRGEKEFDTEFRVVWPLGEVRHLKATAVVLRDGYGKPLRMIGVNYDISARKAAEEELAIKQRQLQTLNETLAAQVAEEVLKNREKDILLLHQDKLAGIGQLSAGVAHEINNPMGFIMSNLVVLKKYNDVEQKYLVALEDALAGCCPEERRKQLEELRQDLDMPFIMQDIPPLIVESLDGAERVKQIVLDLKDFARLDEGNMKETDLNHCVKSTANIVRNEIKYVANLELQLNELPLIVCNPQQINQVIANLLVNAGQAMENHGTITVTSRQEGEEVILSISDTGCGMTEEVRKRIFEPFFTPRISVREPAWASASPTAS